jgi:hypothetical protein
VSSPHPMSAPRAINAPKAMVSRRHGEYIEPVNLWSLATLLARVFPRSKPSLGIPQTSRRACKALQSRTASSLRRAHAGLSVVCLSSRTLERRTSRASRERCAPGQHYDRPLLRAALTLSTRAI